MNRRKLLVVAASLSFALVLALIGMKQGQAQAPKKAHSSMAPLDQYLIADRNAEIALARSAAPDAISGDTKFWSSGAMAAKLPSRGRTALCVLRSEGGCPLPMLRSFGTPKFGANLFQSASRAICFADHLQENRNGVNRTNES